MRVAPILMFGAMALLALPYLFFATVSDVKIVDDEGTLMITFREIMEGHILYRDIFALYGPFYYFSIAPIFSFFQVPLSHDAVRLISAGFWFCSAVTFATIAWRLTGSAIAGAFSLLTALFLLKLFVNSPLHPQELGFLLIGILLHLLIGIERAPKPFAFLLLGGIVGGLLLIKVNLAAFVILPLMLAALRTAGDHWRVAHGILMALAILMPVVLMGPLLHFEWVIRYVVFASATIFAALVVWSSLVLPKVLSVKHLAFVVAGFATVVLTTLGATISRGTTAFDIFRAIVLQNLNLVQNWHLEVSISSGALAVAAISAGYALYYVHARTDALKRQAAAVRVTRLKAGLGLLGALAIGIAAIFDTSWETVPSLMFQFLVPFAWLLTIPHENTEQPHRLTRGIMGLMAACLALYAFPVHGTQTALASLVPTIMLPVLLNDAARDVGMRQLWRGYLPAILRTSPWPRARLSLIAYPFMLMMLGSQIVAEYRRYSSLEPINLPGASLIRSDSYTIQLYHWATHEFKKCRAFYMVPSLPSFYFWAGQRTPTPIMSNNTLGLLSFDQQRRAITELEQNSQLCILIIPALLRYFDRGHLVARPPLLQYVEENFVEAGSNGPFRLLRRKAAD